jgi:hypothetical protein
VLLVITLNLPRMVAAVVFSGSVAPTVDSSFGTVGSGSAYPSQ